MIGVRTKKIVVVIGVIGADVHVVANRLIQISLEQAGFKVVNVGVLASQDDFVRAAKENQAKAIWISSFYGHAYRDCRGLREKCLQAGLGNILIYIGGNLVVGKKRWNKIESKFKKLGFDRVYPPGTLPSQGIKDLLKDLKEEN